MADIAPEVLEIEQRERVRWLWLNRPEKRNALDEATILSLDAAIADAERDAATTALVIAGRGRSFCAGADLSTLLASAEANASPIEFLTTVSRTFRHLELSPLPVVAALHGHAVAGGLELALAADVAIAASRTLIGDGHIRNGLLPGGGASVRLPRKVGPSMARWLMLTGDLVDARTLKGFGWLHAVVPQNRLYEVANSAAARLADRSGPAQSRIKPLLARTEGEQPDLALRSELEVFAEHWDEAAVADSVRAFFAARRDRRDTATDAVAGN